MKKGKPIFYSLFFLSLPLLAANPQEAVQKKAPTILNFLLQPKFFTMLIIGLIAILLLKSGKMKTKIKVPLLLFSTFMFGIAGNLPVKFFSSFSMHPSPICAATKALLYGFRIPMIVMFGMILFLTLIGPKLFCGWICPIGALQELIALWSDKLKIKRKEFSFSLAYKTRALIFILFIFLSATAVIHVVVKGQVIPSSLYDYINPFHGFEFGIKKTLLDNLIHYVPFLLTIVLAFKYYRPFCHFVCPIGMITHIMEPVGLFRIGLNRKSCTDCQICVKVSPCKAVDDILKESQLRPDCYACNICIDSCPEKALKVSTGRVT